MSEWSKNRETGSIAKITQNLGNNIYFWCFCLTINSFLSSQPFLLMEKLDDDHRSSVPVCVLSSWTSLRLLVFFLFNLPNIFLTSLWYYFQPAPRKGADKSSLGAGVTVLSEKTLFLGQKVSVTEDDLTGTAMRKASWFFLQCVLPLIPSFDTVISFLGSKIIYCSVLSMLRIVIN